LVVGGGARGVGCARGGPFVGGGGTRGGAFFSGNFSNNKGGKKVSGGGGGGVTSPTGGGGGGQTTAGARGRGAPPPERGPRGGGERTHHKARAEGTLHTRGGSQRGGGGGGDAHSDCPPHEGWVGFLPGAQKPPPYPARTLGLPSCVPSRERTRQRPEHRGTLGVRAGAAAPRRGARVGALVGRRGGFGRWGHTGAGGTPLPPTPPAARPEAQGEGGGPTVQGGGGEKKVKTPPRNPIKKVNETPTTAPTSGGEGGGCPAGDQEKWLLAPRGGRMEIYPRCWGGTKPKDKEGGGTGGGVPRLERDLLGKKPGWGWGGERRRGGNPK